ncbi:MAG: hypothetical protein ABS46_11565 [Cytophagaceae bacterium SCN 52-12]|nr:MAG: hypothetical protein ABS46_11565 [Cytophagaceae bacterium SCN 52-12]
MKNWKCFSILIALLSPSFTVNAQTLVLDPATHRFLIGEESSRPGLDLIVRSFTDTEKLEIPQYAVIDTLTKPSAQATDHETYLVKAGRMAEPMTLVIRNAEKLPQNYRLEVGGQKAIIDKTGSPISYFQLGGEKCAATFTMPFGIDSTTVSLRDDRGKILSRLHIAYSYPLPELLYIDVKPHNDTEANDTTRLRKFLPGYNKVPTTYSGNGGVPDQLVIGELTMYLGFKKAYYDGFVRHTYVRHHITRKGSENDIKLFPSRKISDGLIRPYGNFREEKFSNAQIDQTSSRWAWLIDGHYEFLYTYSSAVAPLGRYSFEIRHHWLRTWLYNLSGIMWLLPRILAMKPWLTFLLISIFVYFYIRKRLRKAATEAQKANLELQAIQSQLNPHFVFNALSSLQGLINKNETEKANDYLSGFSRLLRNTLNDSGKEMVPLSVEITNIDNYVRLEQLRFGFSYEIVTDELISWVQHTEIPSLLIQPAVENAIKHGIASLGNAGQLTIKFSGDGSDLFISIKDNGRGFKPGTTSEGKGLSLTQERIRLLNKQRHRISMNISSGPEGTEVVLIFKKWL